MTAADAVIVDDRFVHAVDRANSVSAPAEVDRVADHLQHRAPGPLRAALAAVDLGAVASLVRPGGDSRARFARGAALEERPHQRGLVFVDDELPRVRVCYVAERHAPCGATTASAGTPLRLTQPLADEVALELGQARDHVVHELGERPPRPAGALQDHQLDAGLLEPVVEPHPVGHLAGEPVEARDHDDVDPTVHTPREQPPQRGPLEAAAAHAEVVEVLVEGDPALVLHGPHRALLRKSPLPPCARLPLAGVLGCPSQRSRCTSHEVRSCSPRATDWRV